MIELAMRLLTSDAAEIALYCSIGAFLVFLWFDIMGVLRRVEKKVDRGFDRSDAHAQSLRRVVSKVDTRTAEMETRTRANRKTKPYWLTDDEEDYSDYPTVTPVRAGRR